MPSPESTRPTSPSCLHWPVRATHLSCCRALPSLSPWSRSQLAKSDEELRHIEEDLAALRDQHGQLSSALAEKENLYKEAVRPHLSSADVPTAPTCPAGAPGGWMLRQLRSID